HPLNAPNTKPEAVLPPPLPLLKGLQFGSLSSDQPTDVVSIARAALIYASLSIVCNQVLPLTPNGQLVNQFPKEVIVLEFIGANGLEFVANEFVLKEENGLVFEEENEFVDKEVTELIVLKMPMCLFGREKCQKCWVLIKKMQIKKKKEKRNWKKKKEERNWKKKKEERNQKKKRKKEKEKKKKEERNWKKKKEERNEKKKRKKEKEKKKKLGQNRMKNAGKSDPSRRITSEQILEIPEVAESLKKK
ncbi:MAG: hypothetical protein EZS28_039026, partial [Streblomastix strix]